MATKIVTKNSSTASAVPTASDLVQGELAVNVADKRLFTEDNAGAIVELGTNPSTLTVTGEITANGGIALGDNDKATFGAGDDLEIYHNGSNSIITETGTGNLYLGGDNLLLTNGSLSAAYLEAITGGAVNIYHNGSTKLATTSTGIDVTGNMISDGVGIGTSSPSETLHMFKATYPIFKIESTSYNGTLGIDTGNGNLVLNNVSNAGLLFNTNNTERMRIDSSGNVGIGTSSPTAKLTVSGTGVGAAIDWTNTTASTGRSYRWVSLNNGTGFAIEDLTAGSERMRVDASGNVGIGTSSPSFKLDVAGNARANYFALRANESAPSESAFIYRPASGVLGFGTSTAERMRISSAGHTTFGTTDLTPAYNAVNGTSILSDGRINHNAQSQAALTVGRTGTDGAIADFRKSGAVVGTIGVNTSGLYIADAGVGFRFDSGGTDDIIPCNATGGAADASINLGSSGARFQDLYLSGNVQMGGNLDVVGQVSSYDNVGASYTTMNFRATDYIYKNGGNTERMRIDSSGNLLVGKTTTGVAGAGIVMRGGGELFVTRAGDVMNLNRLTSDGPIAYFRKDGAVVGSISSFGGTYLFLGSSGNSNDTYLGFYNGTVRPVNASGTNRDNAIDLGTSSARFDDIYATNGTIQTSDRNEKQDIAELSDAEQRVAVACKGLLRKFRWKDSVAEKGDEARTHFGIIAQDLQDAFAAEGLDAGDYAMFISSTWTDEETNEEKTRMGVRYSELLAFIIAAI